MSNSIQLDVFDDVGAEYAETVFLSVRKSVDLLDVIS